MIIKIKKLIDDAIVPCRGSEHAAGYDLYSLESYELEVGERHAFKTGISMEIPNNLYGRIAPRSGLAVKKGIDTLAGTIDCFSEFSIIKTQNGDRTVKELKIDDIVYSVNKNLEIERDFISAIVNLGERETLKIETENGELELTPGTMVYTELGIKRADELKIGEKILNI